MACNHILRFTDWWSIRDRNDRIIGWKYKMFCIKCPYTETTDDRMF